MLASLEQALVDFCQLFPADSFFSWPFNVKGLLGVIMVCLICGAVGSLVVGNRMAFFSDALAHCAFAGVTLGLLLGVLSGTRIDSTYLEFTLPLIMIAFGVAAGMGIAFVREKSGLASDTVIGVFFAAALGFSAMLGPALSQWGYFDVEQFLFGSPITITLVRLLMLFALSLITVGVLFFMYNQMVFASFNPSLARARNIPVRGGHYLFIVLLALIVNLSIRAVGALLINSALIVPAATASLLCRNMRQLFWTSVALSLSTGVVGIWLSSLVEIQTPAGVLTFGSGGIIVMLSVILFFLAMLISPWVQGSMRGPLSVWREAKP